MPGPSRDWEIMDYYVKHHYILTSLIFQEIAEPGTWYVKEFWVLFRHMTIVFRTKLKKWKSHWCYTTVIDSAVKQDWVSGSHGSREAREAQKCPGRPRIEKSSILFGLSCKTSFHLDLSDFSRNCRARNMISEGFFYSRHLTIVFRTKLKKWKSSGS